MTDYDYIQKSGQGCLAACLAYLVGLKPDEGYEQYMVSRGLFFFRDNFVVGTLVAFCVHKHNNAQKLYVGFAHPGYAQYLQTAASAKLSRMVVRIGYADIKAWLAGGIRQPAILYVDRYALGAGYHYPHFILVLSGTSKTCHVYDSWTGKMRRMSRARIERAVTMLRVHLLVCPVLITAENRNHNRNKM